MILRLYLWGSDADAGAGTGGGEETATGLIVGTERLGLAISISSPKDNMDKYCILYTHN